MNGIIVIDKENGYTSFDVVAKMRRICGEKKIGHTGTLDPMATGVLPILIGNATKAQSLLPESDKEYEATFSFGITTDTLDITGKVLSQTESNVKSEDLEAVLPQFRGDIMQLPPMYSAVSKDGVRLYELARKGLVTEREARSITVYKLDLLNFDEQLQSAKILVKCSQAVRFKNGGGLMLSRTDVDDNSENGAYYRVYNSSDVFLGLGYVNKEKEELSVKKQF